MKKLFLGEFDRLRTGQTVDSETFELARSSLRWYLWESGDLEGALAEADAVLLIAEVLATDDILALVELARTLNFELTIVGAAEGWKVAAQLAEAKVNVVVQPTDNLPGSFDTLGASLGNRRPTRQTVPNARFSPIHLSRT